MSKVSLTLEFDSLDELHEHLNATARQATIRFEDRPDVGLADPTDGSAAGKAATAAAFKAAVVTEPAPSFNPFAAGAAAAQVPPPPAPSTAVAAVPPTVPAAPPATSAPPASAPSVPAPPSAPVAAAPAAPAAPTTLAGIEVDADGLPWDARIHANSKEGKPKNADGRWRQRRGLNDAALKARVEAELRQAMSAATTASVPAAPIVPSVPGVTSATPAIPSPPAASTPTPETFTPAAAATDEPAPQFLARVGGMLASGALTQDRLAAVLATVGLSTMAQLIVAPALIPAVRAQIDAA